jgi:hypothetical protein
MQAPPIGRGHVLNTMFGTWVRADGPRSRDQINKGKSTYPICGFPNLSVGDLLDLG